VFGPRQDPNGPYSAVIPRWIAAIRKGESVQIYGDGKTSRDFCYVDNVVQANLLVGMTNRYSALNGVYNVACGQATSLTMLHEGIREAFKKFRMPVKIRSALHRPFREGDIRRSLASIAKARALLGYRPSDLIDEGITKTIQSYLLCQF
jgi:UDP-N-acetylglucosamine 4-epimerase